MFFERLQSLNSRACFPRTGCRKDSLWRILLRVRAVLLLGVTACLLIVPHCFADSLVKPIAHPRTPAEVEFQKGYEALEANRLADAEVAFRRSSQLDPRLTSALLGLAEIRMRKGDAAGAGPFLQKAAAVAPKNVEVQATWGHYLFFRQRYDEALKVLNAAVRLDPKMARPHYELGDLYLLGLKKPQLSVAAYREALAIDPKNARFHYSLANALAETGQIDQAQSEMEEAVRLEPNDAPLMKWYGDFQLRRGRPDQAMDSFAKALAIDPHYVPALVAQGDVLAQRKQFDQALGKYQEALKIAPQSAEVYARMGLLYEAQQRWSDAEQAYTKATEADPNLAVAWNNLAWLLAEREKQIARALTLARKAVALAPQNADYQDTLGWILRENGEKDGALTALKKAAQLAPQNPQILYHLGVVYQEKGLSQAAAQSLKKALGISKNFEGAQDAEGRLAALGPQK